MYRFLYDFWRKLLAVDTSSSENLTELSIQFMQVFILYFRLTKRYNKIFVYNKIAML